MMNKLYVGFSKQIELPKGGFLFISDEVPDIPRIRVFDPAHHSLNPIKDIDYRKARELADALYTISPQGATTLTVRNGKRSLLKGMLSSRRLDQFKGDEEAQGMVNDLLLSPVLKRVLCNPTNFSFNPNSAVAARLNRAELGDFDALVLGLFLIGHFKGQVIVPDFGFYGRDAHVSLVREGRLIAGVNYLDELPSKIRQTLLSIKDKDIRGALFDDAVLLAKFAGKIAGTNDFNSEVSSSMDD